MSEVLPATLQHAAIPMERHGKNPFNENLYRIVLAPTRFHTIHSGSRKVTAPKYRAAGNYWIMERWLSAYEYTHMTPEAWQMHPCSATLGEYPSRGEYELCHVFEACVPEQANVDKLVMWIEEGRKRSFNEHRIAGKIEYEQEDKDIRNEQDARIRNLLPAFGINAMTGYGGTRGTKTSKIKRFAKNTKEGFSVR